MGSYLPPLFCCAFWHILMDWEDYDSDSPWVMRVRLHPGPLCGMSLVYENYFWKAEALLTRCSSGVKGVCISGTPDSLAHYHFFHEFNS